VPDRLPLTGTPPADIGRRSAALAVWGTEYLRGVLSVDQAVERIVGADDLHVVDPIEQTPGESDLGELLEHLEADGVAGLRLALPIAGDPRGLPGPGPMADSALVAGEAVRTTLEDGSGDRPGYGLVPAVLRQGNDLDGYAITVRWHVYRVPHAAPEPADTRRQAEHELTDALRAATNAMTSLDVARLPPEAAAMLTRIRSAQPALVLPPDHPGAGLWAQAERLAGIVDLAALDDGAAYDRASALARRDVLRELATAVRRARAAAVNARFDLPRA
jgi:hypothetical protein